MQMISCHEIAQDCTPQRRTLFPSPQSVSPLFQREGCKWTAGPCGHAVLFDSCYRCCKRSSFRYFIMKFMKRLGTRATRATLLFAWQLAVQSRFKTGAENMQMCLRALPVALWRNCLSSTPRCTDRKGLEEASLAWCSVVLDQLVQILRECSSCSSATSQLQKRARKLSSCEIASGSTS